MSTADREQQALAWLRALGSGEFSYQAVAEGTGMTRTQALVACLALLRRGDVDYVQWMGNLGRDLYELRGFEAEQPVG